MLQDHSKSPRNHSWPMAREWHWCHHKDIFRSKLVNMTALSPRQVQLHYRDDLRRMTLEERGRRARRGWKSQWITTFNIPLALGDHGRLRRGKTTLSFLSIDHSARCPFSLPAGPRLHCGLALDIYQVYTRRKSLATAVSINWQAAMETALCCWSLS